jgi:hypothetical protein
MTQVFHRIPRPQAGNGQRRWEKAFLTALRNTGIWTTACEAAGIDRTTPYKRMRVDARFAEACREAQEEAADLLESEARRRAVDGVDVPVIYRGRQSWTWQLPDGTVVPEGTAGAEQVPFTVKRYSDPLLMFLLKGLRPWRYGDRPDGRVGILGPGMEPVTAEGTPQGDGPALSPEALVAYRRALMDAGLSG